MKEIIGNGRKKAGMEKEEKKRSTMEENNEKKEGT